MTRVSMMVEDKQGCFAIISGTDIVEMQRRCKARWGNVKLILCESLAYGHDKETGITITPVTTL